MKQNKKLDKVRILPALIFIFAYVALYNIGAVLSAQIGIDYSGQILLLLILSLFIIIYAKKNGFVEEIGLIKINFTDAKKSLFYLPLVLIILANGVFFFDRTISLHVLILSAISMILVAFSEEALFRGLLFKSIEESANAKIAVFISGMTFGFGHIVNFFNGYTGINQLIQIALAILIGILLSMLFIRTKSIIPGIIFHFIFNTVSVLSLDVEPFYNYVSKGFIMLIASLYLFYLLYLLKE